MCAIFCHTRNVDLDMLPTLVCFRGSIPPWFGRAPLFGLFFPNHAMEQLTRLVLARLRLAGTALPPLSSLIRHGIRSRRCIFDRRRNEHYSLDTNQKRLDRTPDSFFCFSNQTDCFDHGALGIDRAPSLPFFRKVIVGLLLSFRSNRYVLIDFTKIKT